MEFFAAQELRRKKTKRLILMYAACIGGTILGIYAVVELCVYLINPAATEASAHQVSESHGLLMLDHWQLLLIVTTATLTVIGVACLMKISELSAGGHHIAAQLGGVRVPASTSDPALRRLLNVVEEMALASGTSVPPVYLLPDEPGINAFAAGHSPGDAVIGVNRGTIDILTRDELQGVIAHEYSHLLNGDMRLNMQLIGWLFGLQVVSLIGLYLLRWGGLSGRHSSRRSNNKDGNNAGAVILLIAAGLAVFGSLGRFFARLIKASISREREFLADASAVQFTRNPDGIAGALKMIAATQAGSRIKSNAAEEVSHMFFANCFKSNFINLLATHPPLGIRIGAVEPDFDGDLDGWLERRRRIQPQDQPSPSSDSKPANPMQNPVPLLGQIFPQTIVDRFPIDPAVILAAIGAPEPQDMTRIQALLNELPRPVLKAARDPFSARCLAFAMLMSDDPDQRECQMAIVESQENSATVSSTRELIETISSLHLIFRLPVMELVQGSLADLSQPQYLQFRNTVEQLVRADNQTSLFEFVVRHHLLVHLDRRFARVKRPTIKYTLPEQIRPEFERMLSAFASASRLGSVLDSGDSQQESDVLPAYRLAMKVAGFDQATIDQCELEPWEVEQLEQCMSKLHHASANLKKQFLHAAAVLITFDHEITVVEAEFFRAVAESLACPVPILAAGRTHRRA